MDRFELRRQKLLAIRDHAFGGSNASLARKLGKTDSYVARMLYTADKKGRKRIGEDMLDAIDTAFGWALGTFDSAESALAAANLAHAYIEVNPAAAEHRKDASDSPITDQKATVIDSQEGKKSSTLSAEVDATSLRSPQRLKASVGITGIAAAELASVAKVGVDTASQWLSGEGPEIGLDQAVAIQNTYGVNAVWLMKGKGKPGVAIRYDDEFRPIPVTVWKPIPVVGMAQLGDNGYWADLEYPVGTGEGYVDFPTRDQNAYALKCEGDSMLPRIQAGEFVIIEPSQPVEPGDDVLLKSKDGRVMIKRFLYKRDGRVHLISVNNAHAPIAFHDDDIEKMHFVRAICRPSAWRPE